MTRFWWVFRATRRVASDVFLKTSTSRLFPVFLKTRATSVLIDLQLKRFHFATYFLPADIFKCQVHAWMIPLLLVALLCTYQCSYLDWMETSYLQATTLWTVRWGKMRNSATEDFSVIEKWTFKVSYFNEVDHSVFFIILYYFILIYL